MLAEFDFKECAPPPHRSTHEVRVVMREAIPRYLTQQLPPGTIHYDANVTDVAATSTGVALYQCICAVHAALALPGTVGLCTECARHACKGWLLSVQASILLPAMRQVQR